MHDKDLGTVTRRGELSVARDEGRSESFRQSDGGRVIAGELVAERPDSRSQGLQVVTLDAEGPVVVQSLADSVRVQDAAKFQTP